MRLTFSDLKSVMTRLNGWQRIGVVASVLWIVLVAAYSFKEISDGPFGTRFLTDVVTSKTHEDNPFRDKPFLGIPVDTTLNPTKLCIVALVPIAALWIGGWAVVDCKRFPAVGRHAVMMMTASMPSKPPRGARRSPRPEEKMGCAEDIGTIGALIGLISVLKK